MICNTRHKQQQQQPKQPQEPQQPQPQPIYYIQKEKVSCPLPSSFVSPLGQLLLREPVWPTGYNSCLLRGFEVQPWGN